MDIRIKIPRPYTVNTGRISVVRASPKGQEGVYIREGTVSIDGQTRSLATGTAMFQDLSAGSHPIVFDVPNFKPVSADNDPENDTYVKAATSPKMYECREMPNVRVAINASVAESVAENFVSTDSIPASSVPRA